MKVMMMLLMGKMLATEVGKIVTMKARVRPCHTRAICAARGPPARRSMAGRNDDMACTGIGQADPLTVG